MKSNVLFVTFFAFLLTGCASHYDPSVISDPYGFFSGFWHGLIFPFALIANFISWVLTIVDVSFLDTVAIIGRPNTGLGYYIGFAIGLCSLSTAN